MSDYPNARDCEHGRHRPSCEICELERELAEAIKERDEARHGLQEWKEFDDFRAKMFAEMSGADCKTLGELHDYVILIKAERDEARECLREAIGFRNTDLNGYDLERWRKAAGLEEPK